ncbi:pyridoxamine 5'-phosphate oxidase family protein [Streptomyces triticirhizae]|uniref:Pyridoxamine 5'-phosphate oxidase family protein n=1 Tax=Streptomyces triticirhizae TaxID=2483353 RepID=A0A3M2KS68_9ACTN|nr:pyridoxamine 5'-phosphate oxidase family protein [Streptomyces triticirhizae]RMI28507.1 pyridoxamine 5'-phosphate oxidase family protein [Streptomyces triticirhizae]
MTEPTTTLAPEFSAPGARPTPWSAAVELLENAEVFWLSTVRPDGRPHVTPLLAIWRDGRAYFTTGAAERKARNLAVNPAVVLTTGRNALAEGLDVTVEGVAAPVTDAAVLRRLAASYAAKYGPDWAFGVGDGVLTHDEGGEALLFEVTPVRAFGFAKGAYAQTRWDLD